MHNAAPIGFTPMEPGFDFPDFKPSVHRREAGMGPIHAAVFPSCSQPRKQKWDADRCLGAVAKVWLGQETGHNGG